MLKGYIMAKKESEFGCGLTYCIGLFLAHSEREFFNTGTNIDYSLWFNGASDHLYELDLSNVNNLSLRYQLNKWRTKVIHWGHGHSEPFATEEDFNWAIQQAKDFLLEIDINIIGVKAIKGQCE